MKTMRMPALLIALTALLAAAAALAQSRNGFDLSAATVPVDEIFSGGPPRDGIPAIDNPRFVPAAAADFLRDDDIVIGVTSGDTARAYPTRILVWHEIVNDRIGELAFAVTYCPLCGTAMVFDRRVGGSERRFGVSGLLYQSDVLMYDRETESLWSQLAMRAVSGAAVGATLNWLPSEYSTWAAWREKHPDGEVLSPDTGHRRDYDRDPYTAYFASDATMFPVPHTRREFANKEWVIGVLRDGVAKAYPISALPSGETITDHIGGKTIQVRYDAARRAPRITTADGATLPSVLVFWFAWQAFYPSTLIWNNDEKDG